MTTILFSLLQEHGHLNPSFKVARELARRGHDVKYLAILDFEAHIRGQGFDFVPFLPELHPRGFIQEQDRLGTYASRRGVTERFDAIAESLRGGALRRQLLALAPAAVVADINHTHLALFALAEGLPLVTMNVTLPQTKDPGVPPLLAGTPYREGPLGRATAEVSWRRTLLVRRLAARAMDVAGICPQFHLTPRWAERFGLPAERLDLDTVYMPRIRGVDELVLCPEAFDFPRPADPHRHYVESIDLARAEPEFPWERVDPGKPLVYVALGSQRFRPGDTPRFLAAVVEAARQRPGWQVIMATGRHLAPEELSPPENLVVVKSAPQLSILRRAQVMVTHGGLGSVKECITYAVPMVVYPLAVDQPGNAMRVEHHHLGLAADVRDPSVPRILGHLERLLIDPSFAERVARMQARFEETEGRHAGAAVVERVIASRGRTD